MTEEFLTHLWKYGLFDRTSLQSDTGEKIEVISLGEHNSNSGPDFINAKIRIGNTLWAGNVETAPQCFRLEKAQSSGRQGL